MRLFQKLHEANLAKEQKLNALYAERADDDTDPKRPQSGGGRVPNNAGLRFELQKKDQVKLPFEQNPICFIEILQEINDLKQQLARTQRPKPSEVHSIE